MGTVTIKIPYNSVEMQALAIESLAKEPEVLANKMTKTEKRLYETAFMEYVETCNREEVEFNVEGAKTYARTIAKERIKQHNNPVIRHETSRKGSNQDNMILGAVYSVEDGTANKSQIIAIRALTAGLIATLPIAGIQGHHALLLAIAKGKIANHWSSHIIYWIQQFMVAYVGLVFQIVLLGLVLTLIAYIFYIAKKSWNKNEPNPMGTVTINE